MVLDGAQRAPAVIVSATLVGLLLIEVLRVWFPSLLFVVGDAGSSSPVTLAAVGIAGLGTAAMLATLVPRFPAGSLWAFGAGALVIGRAALLVELSSTARVAASTLAVVGATTAIVALAAWGRADRVVRVSLLAGFVAATCLHAATRTVGLVWPRTTSTLLVGLGLVLGLSVAAVSTTRVLRASATEDRDASHGVHRPAWPWFLLAPTLVLIAMISGVPGRIGVATGWATPVVAATIATSHLAALVAAWLARWLGPARAGVLAAAAVAGGTAAALDASGWPGVLGPSTLLFGLGLAMGAELGPAAHPTSARSRAVAAGVALVGFAAITAAYYLAYDVRLPFNNRLLLLLTAGVGSVLAVSIARVGRRVTVRARFDGRSFAGRLGVVALLVALVAAGARSPSAGPAGDRDPDHLRVALLNVRFGFALDGRFAAEDQAAVLRAQRPDVVVLNEVDRGWLASGGHDALEVIAGDLGLPHVFFAPAADELWGNALLSRYPIVERAAEPLPRGGDPMVRSHFVAVLELDDTRQVGVVGTHLSDLDDEGDTRVPQARAVAATVALLRERQVPTLVVGDLNAPAGSSALAPFETLVTDVLPPGTLTYPADDPTEHLDHVLASAEFRRRAFHLPEVSVSDHRPVVVELSLTTP